MRIVFLISIFVASIFANEVSLDKKIAKLIVLGFEQTSISEDEQLYKDIQNGLGGVILFNKNLKNNLSAKNIISPQQLKKLTSDLQNISKDKLIIGIDEEGGRVARLRETRGFKEFASAFDVAKTSTQNAKEIYTQMAVMLKEYGVNTNFAPSVDLVYEYCPVIAKLNRSFSSEPKIVVEYAKEFILAHKKEGVLTSIKHFPGHGSSKADSHLGFTDITDTWSEKELEPFKKLIDANLADMVMTSHVFNKHFDAKYPASLSKNIITGILRQRLGYDGVVVSDDLQMSAISKNYTLKETITLAMNAGVDILLFGNQFGKHLNLDDVVDIVKAQIKDKKIDINMIEASYKRVISKLGK